MDRMLKKCVPVEPFIQEIQQQKEEERTGCEQLLTG